METGGRRTPVGNGKAWNQNRGREYAGGHAAFAEAGTGVAGGGRVVRGARTVIHAVVHPRHRLVGNQVMVRAVDPAGPLGELAQHRRDLDQEGQGANPW